MKLLTDKQWATIGDCGHGDVAVIDGVEWRLMIQQRGGWLCRVNRDGDHTFLDDDTPIEGVSYIQPKRNHKARKEKAHADEAMGWRGTTK